MATRINIPKWLPAYNRWQIKVRKDGERRTFTCSIEGRKGQIECQKKADAWLNDDIINPNLKVHVLFDRWIEQLKITTSTSHWKQYDQYGRNYIKKQSATKKCHR